MYNKYTGRCTSRWFMVPHIFGLVFSYRTDLVGVIRCTRYFLTTQKRLPQTLLWFHCPLGIVYANRHVSVYLWSSIEIIDLRYAVSNSKTKLSPCGNALEVCLLLGALTLKNGPLKLSYNSSHLEKTHGSGCIGMSARLVCSIKTVFQ